MKLDEVKAKEDPREKLKALRAAAAARAALVPATDKAS
jgi:ATP-dependent DNA helicase Rep